MSKCTRHLWGWITIAQAHCQTWEKKNILKWRRNNPLRPVVNWHQIFSVFQFQYTGYSTPPLCWELWLLHCFRRGFIQDGGGFYPASWSEWESLLVHLITLSHSYDEMLSCMFVHFMSCIFQKYIGCHNFIIISKGWRNIQYWHAQEIMTIAWLVTSYRVPVC